MNGEMSSDIFIFNTVDKSIEACGSNTLKFRHYNNTCFKVANNKVIALVETDSDPQLIRFEKQKGEAGVPKVTIIKVFSAHSHPSDELYQ